MSEQYVNLGRFQATSVTSNEAAAEKLNMPIEQIEGYLNDLYQRLFQMNSRNALIRYQVGLAEGVGVGDLVYFNKNTQRYEKALAVLSSIIPSNGQSVEADSAHVEGIIISSDPSTLTGTLLISGYWKDSPGVSATYPIVDACLGQNAVPGIYYLSPTDAGMAVLDPGSGLRQPCISYYGDGMFSFISFYKANNTHYHMSAIVRTWEPVSVPVQGSTIVCYRYRDTAETGILDRSTTALFVDGILTQIGTTINDTWSIDEEGSLWTNEDPSDKTVVLFNHFPFAYNQAVVRSVESVNAMIEVENHNGSIKLRGYEFEEGDMEPSQVAISGISGKTLLRTPVVPGIMAGPGAKVATAPNGVVTISAETEIGGLHDAYSIVHNGTTLSQGALFQYIVFPVGRVSNIVITLPVKFLSADNEIEWPVSVWAISQGGQAGVFAVDAQFVPDDLTGAAVSPTVIGNNVSFNLGSTTASSSEYVYTVCQLSGTINSNGLLAAKITSPQLSTNALNILRVGFVFAAAGGSQTWENPIWTP